jgi:hypothetical protein
MSTTVRRARILLIETGKTLPFVFCLVVTVSYCENLHSMITDDFVLYDGSFVLNKPVSWFIGQYVEYDMVTVVILLVISVSVETCVWNKVSILYLSVQLAEKEMFISTEFSTAVVYVICVINIAISGYLTYKGMSTLLK